MKKVLAVALVGLAGICVPVVHGAGKFPTTVRFDGIEQRTTTEGTETVFTGRVSSHELVCKGQRRVTVFLVSSGEDVVIGSTETNAPTAGASWTWKVIATGKPLAGTYYARANPTRKCRGDRSENFAIN